MLIFLHQFVSTDNLYLQTRNECRNSLLMTCQYPDRDSASDWRKQIYDQILRLFLRRHFAGKPPMASRKVGCSLRLIFIPYIPVDFNRIKVS